MAYTLPDNIAHRGASGLAPENTVTAFKRAVEIGADGIELDVRLSSDGAPFVLHDARLERTTDGEGLIAEIPSAALQRLDAGAKFGGSHAQTPIPTLDEALAATAPIPTYIEIKVDGAVPAVIETVRRIGATDRCWIISFHERHLMETRAIAPELPTSLIFGPDVSRDEIIRRTAACGARLASAHFSSASEDLCSMAHAAALQIWIWTVDDSARMKRGFELGVDGIVTNRPDVLAEVLQSHKPQM